MAVAANKVGGMLREALEQADIPVKALAIDVNYSEDAFYAAMQGKRKIPREARQAIAQVHPLAGLAVAYEATGYEVFLLKTGDQHPQNVLQKALKEDHEADQALKGMGWRLIDKQGPEDLSDDDRLALGIAAGEVIDEIRALLSLLVVWEDRYKIKLVKMMLETITQEEKEKSGHKDRQIK